LIVSNYGGLVGPVREAPILALPAIVDAVQGIVKADIEGGVLVARDVGSIVVGQDLQVTHLSSDAAHEQFAVSESLVLKIEAPDAICTITNNSRQQRTTPAQ